MPQFRMTYPYPRVFESWGTLEPGAVVDAEENPDPHFFVEVKRSAKAAEANTDKSEE